jgi:protein phosphatase-4 regulatory subunit 3
MLRMLLDVDTMPTDKEGFLEHLYSQHISVLADALVATRATVNSRYHACELLAFCLQQHQWRAKHHMLMHNVMQKAIGLLQLEAPLLTAQLTCSVVRFIRACIGIKDEFYCRRIVQQRLLDPIINIFLANGARYNLLNSVVIEMIHFIQSENVKSLVDYLITNFGDRFNHVSYVPTFKQLRQRWEQNNEGPSSHDHDNETSQNGFERRPSGAVGPWRSGLGPKVGVTHISFLHLYIPAFVLMYNYM